MRPPEPLTADHDLTRFSCGRPELDDWLKRHALANEGRTSRTYVVSLERRVLAFCALAAGSVQREVLPRKLRHGTPQQIPVIVLGRLGTDEAFQGRGIGKHLLRDAIARTIAAAKTIGVRALLVHALDAEAAMFYAKYGFVPCPVGERTLLLPLETAIGALAPQTPSPEG
jgi:GNAT superfamily N-acetyltransferase